jgi:ABC-type branched-subunit amino acid transport system substrate-binding protein
LRYDQIAFFSQRDAYGDAGFAGALAAIRRRGAPEGFRPTHVRYERNTLDVESALAECLWSNPRPSAVILIGAYAPCAQFIRLARESQFSPLFLTVSFVGAESIARDLGPAAEGVIVTQVVPTLDRDTALSGRFLRALEALPAGLRVDPCLGALEGYLAGRMLCLAMDRCQDAPTPATIANALANLGEFDLGLGTPLKLTADDHQASHLVWPSVIRGERVGALEWKDLPRLNGTIGTAHGLEDANNRP